MLHKHPKPIMLMLTGILLAYSQNGLAISLSISSGGDIKPRIDLDQTIDYPTRQLYPLTNNVVSLQSPPLFYPTPYAFTLDGSGYESVNFFMGTTYESRKFNVLEAGTYELSIADLVFPNPLAGLGVAITTAQNKLSEIFGSGSTLVDLSPGTHYLNYFAQAQNYHDLGLFGMTLRMNGSGVSQVPVPAAAWLLGTGLIAFAGFTRKRRSGVEANTETRGTTAK
jgi:hypothetical protein